MLLECCNAFLVVILAAEIKRQHKFVNGEILIYFVVNIPDIIVGNGDADRVAQPFVKGKSRQILVKRFVIVAPVYRLPKKRCRHTFEVCAKGCFGGVVQGRKQCARSRKIFKCGIESVLVIGGMGEVDTSARTCCNVSCCARAASRAWPAYFSVAANQKGYRDNSRLFC